MSTAEIEGRARDAGARAAASITPSLYSRLLGRETSTRSGRPRSALVRSLVVSPARCLPTPEFRRCERDTFETDRFPDDHYGLVPASLSVLGEEVGDLAIAWGAQKALAHRRRHSPPGP